MSELRKVLQEEYSKKESLMSTDSLIEMIEEMMILGESLGILTEIESAPGTIAGAEAHIQRERILRRVPIPQFSELGWGTAATGDGVQIAIPSSVERSALALYLNNIGGTNLKEKIENLNGFINDPPVDDIKASMSFLVFYRTLSMIIHHFNPSSAGFLFESFLAVLLDSDRGRQVPASDGKTIADIIVQAPGADGTEVYISIKLYSETSLTVGGSFRQLIDDLTGDYNPMQYLVVTKGINADTREVNRLNFYSFTLNRDNVVGAFHFLNPRLLKVPDIFSSENAVEYARMQQLPDDNPDSLEKYLTLPPKALRDITNNFEGFKQKFVGNLNTIDDAIAEKMIVLNGEIEVHNKGLDDRGSTRALRWTPIEKGALPMQDIEEIFLLNVAENYDDKGKLRGAPKDIYMFSGAGSSTTKRGRTYKQWNSVINAMTVKTMTSITGADATNDNKKKRDTALKNHIFGLYKGAITVAYQESMPGQPEESDTSTPAGVGLREQKIANLYGSSAIAGDGARDLLVSLQTSPEKYARALKATAGYQFEEQFEFRKTKLLDLLKSNLVPVEPPGNDPDAPGAFVSLEVGSDKVYKVVSEVLAGIDMSLNTIFDQLELLQDNINKYVAGGLTESSVALKAEKNADVISDKTAQVRTEAAGNEIPKASSGGVGLGKTVRRTGRASPIGRWRFGRE